MLGACGSPSWGRFVSTVSAPTSVDVTGSCSPPWHCAPVFRSPTTASSPRSGGTARPHPRPRCSTGVRPGCGGPGREDDRDGRPRLSTGPGRDGRRSGHFEALAVRGRRLMGPGEPERAAYLFEEALACYEGDRSSDSPTWRGRGLEAGPPATELRLGTEEARVEALVRAGHHDDVLADAQALVAAHPLREHRHELLATRAVPRRAGRPMPWRPCGRYAPASWTSSRWARVPRRSELERGHPAPGPRSHGRLAAEPSRRPARGPVSGATT